MFSHFRVGNIASIRVVRDILKRAVHNMENDIDPEEVFNTPRRQLQLQITINLKN